MLQVKPHYGRCVPWPSELGMEFNVLVVSMQGLKGLSRDYGRLVVGREKRSGKEDANYCRVSGLAPLFEPSTILLPSLFFQDGLRGESRASL